MEAQLLTQLKIKMYLPDKMMISLDKMHFKIKPI